MPCRACQRARGRRGRQPCARVHKPNAGLGSGYGQPTETVSASACRDNGVGSVLIVPSAAALVVWSCSWLLREERMRRRTAGEMPALFSLFPCSSRRSQASRPCRRDCAGVRQPKGGGPATRACRAPSRRRPDELCEEIFGNLRCRFNPKGAHISFPPMRKLIGIAPVSGGVMAAAVYVTFD